MSGGNPALLVLLAVLLALAAAFVLRGKPDRKLRDRVQELGIGSARAEAPAGPSLRAAAPSDRPLWLRLLILLGYNPDVPARYRLAWPALLTAAGVAGGLVFWRGGAMFGPAAGAVLAAATALGVLHILFRRDANRYSRLLFAQIPDAISLVVRAVRAGLPVSEAIRSISEESPSPTAEEFARIAQETAIGTPMEAALWQLHERSQVKEYGFLAVTIGLQAQTGGNLAETLSNLADLVRRRVAMETKVRAITSEGRASAVILAVLPFAAGGLMMLTSPGYITTLFTDERGPTLATAFAVLMSMGLGTIRWLIQRSTRD